jgi:predicted DNA-binding protein (MmcQ/YjbR family)
MPAKNRLSAAETALRKCALGYPQATEDHPWGESAFKIKGKVFLFLSRHNGGLNLSMKLPVSGSEALGLPFASPTGYGLGKSGWVTARFEAGDEVPVEMIREWIDESFRAVAPKRVVAELETNEQ